MGKTLQSLQKIYEYAWRKARGESTASIKLEFETDEDIDFNIIQDIIQTLCDITYNTEMDLLCKMDCYLDVLNEIADLMIPSHLEFSRKKYAESNCRIWDETFGWIRKNNK